MTRERIIPIYQRLSQKVHKGWKKLAWGVSELAPSKTDRAHARQFLYERIRLWVTYELVNSAQQKPAVERQQHETDFLGAWEIDRGRIVECNDSYKRSLHRIE